MIRDKSGARWVTRAELAEAIGVSVRTVTNLEKAGLASRRHGGAAYFAWPASNVWYITWKSKSRRKEEADARSADARAAMYEWQLAEKRRQVVSVGYLEREVAGLSAAFRGAALALPGRVAGEAAHQSAAEIQLIVERAVADMFSSVRTAALALGGPPAVLVTREAT